MSECVNIRRDVVFSLPERSPMDRLCGLINLHMDYLSWLLYYCRQTLLGAAEFTLRGMTISRMELELAGLDCEELLSQLIAGDVDNLFVQGTKTFDYRDESGSEQTSAPAADIDAIQIIRLHLKAEIAAFPYPYYLNALHRLCQTLNYRYNDFLFPHYSYPCEDPIRLAQSLLNRECDPFLVASELDVWRIRINERLRILESGSKPVIKLLPVEPLSLEQVLAMIRRNALALERSDPRIQRTIRRPVMARLIGRSPETIRNWDRNGVAAADIPWPQPSRTLTGHAEYFLPNYLEGLQQLIPRYRDPDRDRQLRDEIIGQRYAE